MKNLIAILFFTGLSLTISCKKKKEELSAVLPTNISTSIIKNNNQVSVTVKADNANFYSVTFYDATDSVYVESTDGIASYTYTSSGNYTLKSRAYTTHENYIEKIDVVTITLSVDSTGAPNSGFTSPLTYSGYSLAWNDEFDGNDLSSDWVFDIGTGNSGWGNNELQYYTNQNYNVSNGLLEIKARKEPFNAQQYTSTRIKTQGINSWKYGRIDVRAALPFGQGIWPAIWMLGDNISSVGWPSCGEIDIMEMIGGEGYNDRTVHGTVHWEENGHAQYGDSKTLPSGKFADEFHVFSIIWDQTSIKWLVDNVQYNQITTTSAEMNEFQQKFFLILNVAVGGNWPGSPNNSTIFPQSMYVDYVRVFQ